MRIGRVELRCSDGGSVGGGGTPTAVGGGDTAATDSIALTLPTARMLIFSPASWNTDTRIAATVLFTSTALNSVCTAAASSRLVVTVTLRDVPPLATAGGGVCCDNAGGCCIACGGSDGGGGGINPVAFVELPVMFKKVVFEVVFVMIMLTPFVPLVLVTFTLLVIL
jgi:hypothetical protein